MNLLKNKIALAFISALFAVACTTSNQQESASIDQQSNERKRQLVQLDAPAAQQAAEDLSVRELAVDRGQPIVSFAVQKSKAEMGTMQSVMAFDSIQYVPEPLDRENYAHYENNPLKLVSESPVSTFSIDVDTGSYANVRRFLNQGRWPRADAVRTEELINYFHYNYALAESRQHPFSVHTELAVTPWNQNTHLLHIGIRGYEKPNGVLPPSNLVFLLDVSGSMNSPDKIGLLVSALKMLARQMTAQDRIAIAVYAGAAGTVLEPTAGNEYGKIEGALHRLQAGGSTNGAAGIQLAYQLARQSFIEGGVNRVLLATDGDFNVGTTNFEALMELVKLNRESGIALTTLGFGSGNYNDHLMEQLADVGDGNYAYIDTLKEAHKVLVDERAATLLTIAKDVKIQIEFNPSQVAEYRLIGYENRALAREDFNNDRVDAGDIGAGHTVTALYEITLQSSSAKRIDPLRYVKKSTAEPTSSEIAFLRLRYKQPDESSSRLIERAVSAASIAPSLADTSENFRFAASIAAFGQTLRGGKYLQEFDYTAIRELAGNARGDDRFGYRGEFLQLLGLAESLDTRRQSAAPDTRDDTAG